MSYPKMTGDREDVFVAAAAHVHHDQPILAELLRDVAHARKRVRRLKRGDDAFEFRAELERIERFLVRAGAIGGPARLVQEGVLWTDARIIEAGRYRMSVGDLSVLVLQEICAIAMQNAGLSP